MSDPVIKHGDRVYVRSLDVYGSVDMILQPVFGPRRYTVVCEPPLPGRRVVVAASDVQPA